MRATTESRGMRRLPTTCGWHSACGPAVLVCAAAGVSCSWACAGSVKAVAIAHVRPRTRRLERVCTDLNMLPRRLPLTRSTVKIRTPSLLKKSRPEQHCWGKLDYMGAAWPGASSGPKLADGFDSRERERLGAVNPHGSAAKSGVIPSASATSAIDEADRKADC